ncbi:hypothetical protein [Herbidospora sp. RD11066]
MFRKRPKPEAVMRELLYGDVPLERWAENDPVFSAVRGSVAVGDGAQARSVLHSILASPDRPSRDHLQAWHVLRLLGEEPDDPAYVHGVVVDMPVGKGLDTLAVYRDGTCRYLNHSGKILVWEASDAGIDALAADVVAAGAAIASRIGPWIGPRPPLPQGVLRLSMLCSGGLYFGEGPASALMADPMAGHLVNASVRLLEALTSRAGA